MTGNNNPRAHLDQYAAALRDLRPTGAARSGHVSLPPGFNFAPEQAQQVRDRIAALSDDDRLDETIATLAGLLTEHLPFVQSENIGAVLLDLSQLMLGFVGHPDAEKAASAAADLPLLVALVGQEMYSGGAR